VRFLWAALVAVAFVSFGNIAVRSADNPDGAGCSPSRYGTINNAVPLPVNFCAYDKLPWRNFVGPTPSSTDAANSSIVQKYAAGTGAGDEYFTTYATLKVDGTGIGGYPVYYAATTDPAVYINCSSGSVKYGCTVGSGKAGPARTAITSSAYGPFNIPTQARPGSTNSNNSGDENMTVIQPAGGSHPGLVVNLYFTGCNNWSNWTSSDIVGTNVCSGSFVGASFSHVATDNGVNPGNIDGGDDFAAIIPHYNEVVTTGVINHALELRVSCLAGPPARFPGTTAEVCNSGGLIAGAHIHLRRTHAQMDAIGANITNYSYLKPFYYALIDYGGFVLDTSGPSTSYKFVGPISIEDASVWLRSGGSNPWVAWFHAQGAPLYHNANGTFFYYKVNFFIPIASYLEVLAPCHDIGAC
jgi:hypothetical protein